MDRICVSTWSFHNLFTSTRYPGAEVPEKDFDVLDFPEMVADRYGVHNVEVVSKHFLSTESAYFAEFRERLKKAKSRLINIPVDIAELWEQPSISSPDASVRERAIGLYKPWIGYAAELGARSVRCDPGILNLDDATATIASYKELVAHAAPLGIEVTVENHGTASAYPVALAEILRASGAGALPDIRNFPDNETRLVGLQELFPLARTLCHTDLAPSRFDFAECIRISQDAGFAGVYSIEAGDSPTPYEAVRQVYDELVRVLG